MTADEREDVIRAHFPLVRKIARRVHRMVPTVDIGDLVGDGSIGLIRAVDQFDASRGIPLEQYARRLISGAMLNGIRRMDPVPERARRLVREGEAARYRMACERGSLPLNAEIEQIMPGFVRASGAAHDGVPLSLDAPLPEGERMAFDWAGDPAGIVVERMRDRQLHGALDALPERQRLVLHGHYFGDRSLRDVGKEMSISAQRASQLHQTAIFKLRKALDVAPR